MAFYLQHKKSHCYFKSLESVGHVERTIIDVVDINQARKFTTKKAAILYRRDRLRMVDEYEIVECTS